MIRSAQLRVYMPLERIGAFESHLFGGRPVVRTSGELVWAEPTTNDAFTAEWRGASHLCPRYPRLRMLEGIVAFWRDNPGSSVLSELAARRARQELVRLHAEAPEARSYIQSAAWHVPLRWFAAFDPEGREMYTASHGASIRYRTDLGSAVQRVSRAVEILEGAGFDDGVLDDVRDLERWLGEFGAEGMLELDYRDTASLFDAATLLLDQSAADIARSLAALEHHDYEEAGLAYAQVAGRWAPAQALAYVN